MNMNEQLMSAMNKNIRKNKMLLEESHKKDIKLIYTITKTNAKETNGRKHNLKKRKNVKNAVNTSSTPL